MNETQLRIYALELAALHRLLRSRVNAWMETEQYLRIRGTHAEVIHQVLSAAYMAAQQVRQNELPSPARATAADRLTAVLQRGLATMRDYRTQMGPHAQDDLGAIALLRSELRDRAVARGWDVQFSIENADMPRLPPLSETAAYMIVCEALDFAAANPHIRKVSLTVAAESDRLRIQLTFRAEAARPEQVPGADHPAAMLTRLYARRAGGACTWKRLLTGATDIGTPICVELVLPCAPHIREHLVCR